MKKAFSYKLSIFLFLLPALLLFIGVLIAPIFLSIYYGFCNKKGAGGVETWIGFANYVELFTSTSIGFWKALGNSMLLALFSVGIQLPLALLLALKLGKGVRGERGFLSVYFMPVLISTVVIGQLWLKIYHPDYGILNQSGVMAERKDWCLGYQGCLVVKNKSACSGSVLCTDTVAVCRIPYAADVCWDKECSERFA